MRLVLWKIYTSKILCKNILAQFILKNTLVEMTMSKETGHINTWVSTDFDVEVPLWKIKYHLFTCQGEEGGGDFMAKI